MALESEWLDSFLSDRFEQGQTANISNDPASPTDWIRLEDDTIGHAVESAVAQEAPGDSTTTHLLDPPEACLIVVAGRDAGGFDRFVDLLLFVQSGGVTTVSSETNGSPGTRTYSQTTGASALDIEIASGGGTFNVVAATVGGDSLS